MPKKDWALHTKKEKTRHDDGNAGWISFDN